MRKQIEELIDAGKTDEEIVNIMAEEDDFIGTRWVDSEGNEFTVVDVDDKNHERYIARGAAGDMIFYKEEAEKYYDKVKENKK